MFSLVLIAVLHQIPPAVSVLAQQPSPGIERVELTGKRLVVTGTNFDRGAVIEIDGREIATRAPLDAPIETLIAKKGGKRLSIGEQSAITVRNSDGQRSRALFIFRTDDFIAAYIVAALTPWVNINSHGAFLSLQPGDHFIVDLSGISGASLTQAIDPSSTLEAVVRHPFDDNLKFLYRVKHSGSAQLTFHQMFDSPGDVLPFDLLVTVVVQ
jgi:hypothetical protein